MKRNKWNPPKFEIGQEFHRLKVIADEIEYNEQGKIIVYCECQCGTKLWVEGIKLDKELKKSCGCLRRDAARTRKHTHGKSHTPLYNRWRGMKLRCYTVKNPSYSKYGGRGIRVCNEWINDFLVFYKWGIENGYQDSMILDRKDNDKNYCPDNCRWVSALHSTTNRRPFLKGSSKYKGVLMIDGKWKAAIQSGYKSKWLGTFPTEEDAARAYNKAAYNLWGEFAYLNKIEENNE